MIRRLVRAIAAIMGVRRDPGASHIRPASGSRPELRYVTHTERSQWRLSEPSPRSLVHWGPRGSFLRLAQQALLAGCLVAMSPTFAAELAGEVIRVADGDTLTIRDAAGRQWVIRLTDIDAPELGHGRSRPGQPYARAARDYLRDAAQGRQATAECYDVDRRHSRERHVCRVFVDGRDLSVAMLDAGLAMVQGISPRYVRDGRAHELERRARANRRGLWTQPVPVLPWEWRKKCWEKAQCSGAGPSARTVPTTK